MHSLVTEKKRKTWRSFTRSPLFDIGQFLLLLVLVCYFFARSVEDMGYQWQWYQIPRYLYVWDDSGFMAGPLLYGLGVTVKISAISLGLAFVVGLITALLRLSNSVPGKVVARFYLEISRNTPLLIQLFFIYFVMGPILGLDRFWAAVLALSLFEGAYASEILRSGIMSVEKGQWEASHSLGLSYNHAYRFIVFPQAVRRVLPPLASQAISLIKDSALVSTIAVYDLTMEVQALISETFLTFELWFTVALMYLVITVSLSILVSYLEKQMSSPYRSDLSF
ncbi:amino acid ABC transporter membrane protein 1, PAAT family [Desulfocapsa sulfexigens DSM 10523]|uniref:Putative glutamine transport system permease protein GlnP n=1 Tax=Desulfocapsa sulfexigens (strain DSM 10523 / SB164P1) TaxID=1167006 RepID=M1NCZ8_DESSD|nr:amino acid ABC transporter membrane protein 1, PAAT family [Desulfocapsa sulfexigens DSM 10523]